MVIDRMRLTRALRIGATSPFVERKKNPELFCGFNIK
jgi:hypothetical protein